MAKQITIKSYTSAGVFIKVLTDATFGSFRKSINGGLGFMTFDLARKLDNFNSNSDVSIGNRIDILVNDEDSGIEGVKIYTGFIEQHYPSISGGDESVQIVCVGVVNRLALDVLKSGSQTTLYTDSSAGLDTSTPSNAAEVATVVKAGITLFNTNNPAVPLIYDTSGGSTVVTTGANINYDFVGQTYFDFLKKCLEAAPANWFFYIGADNIIKFQSPPTTATHNFLLGKDISVIKVQKGVDSAKNVLLLFDGDTNYRQYKDDTSIALYGRRVKIITDSRIKDTATMDNVGAAFIAENKDPRTRVTLEIIDNNEDPTKGYNIESIDPGNTCRVTGIAVGDLLGENMIITEVEYSLGKAVVTIEARPEFDVNNFIVKLQKDIEEQQKAALPETYT